MNDAGDDVLPHQVVQVGQDQEHRDGENDQADLPDFLGLFEHALPFLLFYCRYSVGSFLQGMSCATRRLLSSVKRN